MIFGKNVGLNGTLSRFYIFKLRILLERKTKKENNLCFQNYGSVFCNMDVRFDTDKNDGNKLISIDIDKNF